MPSCRLSLLPFALSLHPLNNYTLCSASPQFIDRNRPRGPVGVPQPGLPEAIGETKASWPSSSKYAVCSVRLIITCVCRALNLGMNSNIKRAIANLATTFMAANRFAFKGIQTLSLCLLPSSPMIFSIRSSHSQLANRLVPQ